MKRSKLFAITLQSKSGLIFFFVLAAYNPCSIQSAVGRVSERLFCSFTDAVDVLFTLGVADIIFRPENTVNAYACSRAYCPILRYANKYC